jgi:hypothetical protein
LVNSFFLVASFYPFSIFFLILLFQRALENVVGCDLSEFAEPDISKLEQASKLGQGSLSTPSTSGSAGKKKNRC